MNSIYVYLCLQEKNQNSTKKAADNDENAAGKSVDGRFIN